VYILLSIETSVVFAYTLAQEKEPEHFAATARLIGKINRGELQAMTSL